MESKPRSDGRDASLTAVTHVFFDVGGTLLSPVPGPVEIFRRALAHRGQVLDRGTLSKALRSPELIVTLIRPMTAALEPEFFRSVNARLVEHLGLAVDPETLDDIHASFERDVVYTPYPETVRTLRALRARGFKTGVVSNFSHRLPRVLRDAGIADYVDGTTYSFEVGAEKPHPKIFRAAIARAGTTAEHALMVGDSYQADYLGARNVGLHALLLSRTGDATALCPTIRSLDELPGLLGAGPDEG